MCRYNISIDDAVMEEVRPSITSGMDEDAWVQLQVEALFSRMNWRIVSDEALSCGHERSH